MNLALLLASLAAAATSRPIGDGAQRLVVGALKEARERFSPDACFAGVAIEASRPIKPVGPGARAGRITTFSYRFAAKDGGGWEVFYAEPEGPPPLDPGGTICELEKYYGGKPHAGKPCITEMSIDSDEAIGIAMRHGLPGPGEDGLLLFLHYVDRQSSLWSRKKMRNKTVWVISENKGRGRQSQVAVLDAASGRVLESGTQAVLHRGSAGGEELKYPSDSPGMNLCSEGL